MKTLLLLILAIAFAAAAYGFRPYRVSISGNVALAGYDPVVIYAQGKALRGRPEYTVVHDGVEWRFVNMTNKMLFEKHPEMFVPAFGGYCAYGVAMGQVDEKAEARAFVVRDGKVYFFHDEKMLTKWKDNPDELIAQAQAHWERMVKAGSEKDKSQGN